MRVTNMLSPRSNNPVANQFIVTDGADRYFQSYDSVIVKVTPKGTFLDEKYWDCSVTTSKYRNRFLGENSAETKRKINDGTYILTNLNGDA